ncbi:hypothetical protein [Qipengyuania sediminis]|uniref:hypothetical protein n=1 Tax=Qipengyuania sediminis TaxID=1532023 RepID=UPI00105960A8|nr:hypothetical protein [Qipengyuania sediminis]
MSAFVIAGLILAQAAPITVEAPRAGEDVGFRELVADRPADAIARIEANRALAADDPAALLNRGAAEMRLGRYDAARDSYRAALASRTSYDLELRDGSWVNSRDAARRAIRLLSRGETLALK